MSSMGKLRVYDLAKELKLENRKVIEDARRLGVDVSVPSNTLDDAIADKIREMYFPKKEPVTTHRTSRLIKLPTPAPAAAPQAAVPQPVERAAAPAPVREDAPKITQLPLPGKAQPVTAQSPAPMPAPSAPAVPMEEAPKPRIVKLPTPALPTVPAPTASVTSADKARIIIEKCRRHRATELNLSQIGVGHLRDEIGELSQLNGLHLNANQLKTLPESISELLQLRYLDVSDNQLEELPELMGQMSQLEYLDLSNNRLTTLPESIGQMSQLRYLDLSSNQLTEIPESIGQLSHLEYLILTENKLSSLPESVRDLESLKEIYLHGNSGLELPTEVLGERWQDVIHQKASPAKPDDILEFYSRVREERRPLNEAKLILVGRGGVGKTSLVNRLVHSHFGKDEKKTEGISITGWQITLRDNESVRLNIWDFGGQEVMHATHQFFLTQRSLYLLVLSGREGGEDTDAEYWLKLIESFGGNSPIIVVLNKIKEHAFEVNRRALLQKYPSIRDFIKTDCEDGDGIDELRRCIEREADRLDNLRAAFPTRWFSIKTHLAEMSENYVTFDRYRQICRRYGERDEEAQDKLALHLHDLGIALNYKDDPRLQEMRVLSPQWVTNGIYGILNSEKLEKQKGEIRLDDLATGILDGRKYSPEMKRFLFDLMRKFELSFSFPDDEFHYLVPELLDKQEPPETAAFNPAECLNFQYHYQVLPEGVLPRFIVRTQSLSEGQWRWRTGVILKFEDCRALVKADVQDRKVLIDVSGPVADRRRLLAVIRSDFERIHSDIRNLNPQEMVPIPNYPDVAVSYRDLLVMEHEGERELKTVADGRVIKLSVQELLNGVDLTETRRGIGGGLSERRRLFYSYSHKDEALRNELETHLKLLHRVGLIESWHDRQIDAGDDWKHKIDENLERADIVLLLISANFLASDYCYEIEMKRALERHERNKACVVPIVVRDVSWGKAPFAKLQALPKDGLAIELWPNRDQAWRNVSEGIERIVEQMNEKAR